MILRHLGPDPEPLGTQRFDALMRRETAARPPAAARRRSPELRRDAPPARGAAARAER